MRLCLGLYGGPREGGYDRGTPVVALLFAARLSALAETGCLVWRPTRARNLLSRREGGCKQRACGDRLPALTMPAPPPACFELGGLGAASSPSLSLSLYQGVRRGAHTLAQSRTLSFHTLAHSHTLSIATAARADDARSAACLLRAWGLRVEEFLFLCWRRMTAPPAWLEVES